MMHRHQLERFTKRLEAEGAAAVIATGSPPKRNADSEYRFRPDSDFFYLTGFREPDAVLVVVPDNGEARTILFLRDKNPEEEIWTGRRLGVQAAPEYLGIDRAFPLEEFWSRLPGLLRGHRRVVYRTGRDEARDRGMLETVDKLRRQVRGGVIAPSEWIDPSQWLHEQRLFKTSDEIAVLRHASKITAEAHTRAMRETQPGLNEAEIDALLTYTFLRRGSTGPSYTNIVAGGDNACILHYVENDQALEDGELLLIDAGAEWNYYASDVTRTFPINGRFNDEQRALYELVLSAQKKAVEHVRPGHTFASVHDVAVETLTRGLVDLGLLSGSPEELIENDDYRRFYMHRTGHWLGLDVHDCGAYYSEGGSRGLEAGMVTTVEPGLYVAPDDETVEPRWRGIGIRIEDDVLVTTQGNEVLSAETPKEVEDVEAVCQGAELQPAG